MDLLLNNMETSEENCFYSNFLESTYTEGVGFDLSQLNQNDFTLANDLQSNLEYSDDSKSPQSVSTCFKLIKTNKLVIFFLNINSRWLIWARI